MSKPLRGSTKQADTEKVLPRARVVAELVRRARANGNGAISDEEIRRASRTANEKARELLKKWMADESGYDEETWPVLKKALDENRSPAEKLFSD